MHQLFTAIRINAPRGFVWNVLIDLKRYPEWNPYIPRITGQLAKQQILKVHARPSGTMGRTFYPEVLAVTPPKELRWVGRLPRPGILDGEHIFELESLDKKTVELIHRENFTGWMAPMHKLFRLAATRRGFEEMNAALKQRAEQLYLLSDSNSS